MADPRPRRFVVAITGATGAVYGVRLLERLRAIPGVETHLVISDAATLTLHQEVGLQRRDVEALAHVVHKNRTTLDQLYATNWSLLWDIKILVRTIPAVLTAHGAH